MSSFSPTSLSPERRRLLTILRTLNFGRIENLQIRNGEPVLNPMPKLVREYKFAGENGPRVDATLHDLVHKDQFRDLFRLLDEVGTGVIAVLTCKHGVPFQAELLG